MAVTAESSNSLYIEEQDFNQLVWNKVSYWTFLAVYTILLQRNIQLENLLLYNFFSSFKLQKHQGILFCCSRYRVRFDDKIAEIVLLFLTFTSASLLPLPATTRVCFTRHYCVC